MKPQQIKPNIYLIDDFLSPEECQQHIASSEKIGYELAKVNVNGVQTLMTSVRNNQRVLHFDQNLADLIWNRLSMYAPEIEGTIPCGLNEMWRYYRYSPGEQFKLHRDGSYYRSISERSYFTLLIYLNADFEGGATGFEREFDIEPKEGRAVIFEHRIKHEGKPISNGTKYVLRTDIMYKRMNTSL